MLTDEVEVLDLTIAAGSIRSATERYQALSDDGRDPFAIEWTAIKAPKGFQRIGGGVAFVRRRDNGEERRPSRSLREIMSGGNGHFVWHDETHPDGLLLIAIFPNGFRLEETIGSSKRPMMAKPFNGRMAICWRLTSADVRLDWKIIPSDDSGIRESCFAINRNGIQMDAKELESRTTPRTFSELKHEVRCDDSVAPSPVWDLFICHASEDKDDVARPLGEYFACKGLKVWYDETTLQVGDSLRRSIDHGLANCRFGIVILSPHFFENEWTNRELDGLVARDNGSEKRILPVWHNVTRKEVVAFSPTLADKFAVTTSRGLEHVTREILRVIEVTANNAAEHSGSLDVDKIANAVSIETVDANRPAQEDATVPEAESKPSSNQEVPVTHVVLLIHGIRDEGDWQEMIANQIESPEIRVFPVKYGFLDVFQFLLPGPTRSWPVQRLYTEIKLIRDRFPTAKLSVIAHSFGTYIVSRIVEENFEVRLFRILFCGAVVRRSYPWKRVLRQITEDQVLNECGKSDVYPVLAQSVTWGYGASGTHGFGTVVAKDRFHPGGHSQYFDVEFVKKYWVPFIRNGKIERSEWEKSRPSTPLWLSLLGWLPLKYLLLAFIGLAVFGSLPVKALFADVLSLIIVSAPSKDTVSPPGQKPPDNNGSAEHIAFVFDPQWHNVSYYRLREDSDKKMAAANVVVLRLSKKYATGKSSDLRQYCEALPNLECVEFHDTDGSFIALFPVHMLRDHDGYDIIRCSDVVNAIGSQDFDRFPGVTAKVQMGSTKEQAVATMRSDATNFAAIVNEKNNAVGLVRQGQSGACVERMFRNCEIP